MRTVIAFALILGSSTVLNAGGESGSTADIEKVYVAKCAVCHAKDGSGDTPQGKKLEMRDLRSAEVQKMSDEEMYLMTAKGKEKRMPAYEKKLTETQIKELVWYVRQMAKK